MRRLVQTWERAEREFYDNSLPDAAKLLTKETGVKPDGSRIGEWKRGKHVPSARVLSYMLYSSLRWALRNAGIVATEEQLTALEELLWVRKAAGEGEVDVELT